MPLPLLGSVAAGHQTIGFLFAVDTQLYLYFAVSARKCNYRFAQNRNLHSEIALLSFINVIYRGGLQIYYAIEILEGNYLKQFLTDTVKMQKQPN
jgi:hypothetical protein